MKNLHDKLFYIILYLSYILYFIAYFQIKNYNPEYLHILDDIIKYYVIAFLLIRFNPIIHVRFTEFDRTIVFSSGMFLLTTTTFGDILQKYRPKI